MADRLLLYRLADTSAYALNNATLPYVLKLANLGWQVACKQDAGLLNGLNVHAGKLYCPPVGQAQGKPSLRPEQALSACDLGERTVLWDTDACMGRSR